MFLLLPFRNIEEILAAKGEAVQKLKDIDIPKDILVQFQKECNKKASI